MVKRTLRQRIAAWIAGPQRAPARGVRMYANARGTRTTAGFGSSGNSSADAELSTSLASLRARSRQLIRDSAYAYRAQQIIVNNVVGSGVGLQAQVMTTRDALAERVNADIEAAWCEWSQADACHTGGTLHFADLERQALAQVFEAGEIFIRKHYRRFGQSRVPLALELVEAERVADHIVDPGMVTDSTELRMGVEVDEFMRPVAYWFKRKHPGDIRSRVDQADRYERVPAEDVHHIRVIERSPQTRGAPWMHTVLRKFDEVNEYTGSEVSAARASAHYFATVTTPEGGEALPTEKADDGSTQLEIEPLMIQKLKPGETLDFHAPNRPNPALSEFIRAMLRELAAGTTTSYESLSRDYSQSNYSSSRLALLDDRDSYKALQQWWIRTFRAPLHRVWMQQAVLAGAITSIPRAAFAADMEKYCAVKWKPRGWSWVDPTKEVTAYKEAIMAGMTTLTDVIAQTADGRDIEDFITTRRRELDMLDAADIDVDTTVEEPMAPAAAAAPAEPATDPQDDADEDTAPARARLVVNR